MTASRSCFYTLVSQRSSLVCVYSPYLQLLCAPHKVGRQCLHQTLQVHALNALQVDKVIAARKEGRNHQSEQAAEPENPEVLPLAILALSLLFQCMKLLGGDNA